MSVKNNNSIVGIVNIMIMNNMNSSFFLYFQITNAHSYSQN